MKEIIRLSAEKKAEAGRLHFEEGESTNSLARKYGVCQRTIIRICNKYRNWGAEAFLPKERKKVKKEETLEEKVARLELENEILKTFQRELLPYSKKK